MEGGREGNCDDGWGKGRKGRSEEEKELRSESAGRNGGSKDIEYVFLNMSNE